MEDRVADVLVQRAALDTGFAGGILVSLFLHAGVTAAAIYAAMHAAAPPAVTGLTIKFAPVVQSAAPPQVKQPSTSPRIDAPKPQPVKPVETKKPVEKNAVPLSTFGRSEKKGSENPVVAPPAVAQPHVPAAAAVVPGASGVAAALDGGDFPYTLYIERMTTMIGQRWFRPQSGNVTTVVYFVIDRDGTIRDAKTEVSSGNSTFDRGALRAVLETSPLPPLPFGYAGTYLGVHLTFK